MLLDDKQRRNVQQKVIDNINKSLPGGSPKYKDRVVGDGGLLLLDGSQNVSRKDIKNEFLPELLRSAVVAIVSALDKYLHDVVVEKCIILLRKDHDLIPEPLLQIKLNVSVLKKIDQKIEEKRKRKPRGKKGNGSIRISWIYKKAIQDSIHTISFQSPKNITLALAMLGIKDSWNKIILSLNSKGITITRKELDTKLNILAKRRHQIAHEGDVKRKTKNTNLTLNSIDIIEVNDYLETVKAVTAEIDQLVQQI